MFTNTHRFSHQAMATVFEILIQHEDQHYAHQAAWEAFRELERLEQELSRFNQNSDIGRINALSKNQSTILGLDTFECLRQCADLYEETGGAFDISIGTLMNCWLNPDKTLRQPTFEELEQAQRATGLNQLILDETNFTVRLVGATIHLDLGGFGKGYAVDKMAELLLDWEISPFFIHGGTSSVLAVDAPADSEGWPISLSNPFENGALIRQIKLRDRAMSGSGLQKGQHIIDPRTGQPLKNQRAAWSFAPTAAICDALSTAFMLMTPGEITRYCENHPDVAAIVLTNAEVAGGNIKYFSFSDSD